MYVVYVCFIFVVFIQFMCSAFVYGHIVVFIYSLRTIVYLNYNNYVYFVVAFIFIHKCFCPHEHTLQGLLSLLEQVETKATSKSSDPDKETKVCIPAHTTHTIIIECLCTVYSLCVSITCTPLTDLGGSGQGGCGLSSGPPHPRPGR